MSWIFRGKGTTGAERGADQGKITREEESREKKVQGLRPVKDPENESH